jgi:uncharacterized protein (DUF362 family)
VAQGLDAYANALEALKSFAWSAVAGKRVLLKPNAGRMAAFGTGTNTNPQVVAAAIDFLRAAGAEVAVGESPITGVKALEALEVAGIAEVARARGCPLIDLDARPPVAIDIPGGRAIQSLTLCADVLDFDFVVSVPVMKVHMHTGVTLSVKNMKGCLWRRSKVDLHMLPQLEGCPHKSLDVAIGDMATVLRPHFALIDGSVCMEGLGPGAGTPRPLNVVVAGGDGFAADAVACRLMGRDAAQVPHLLLGAASGCGVIDLSRIEVSPDGWQKAAADLAPPPHNLTFPFPQVEVLDRNSCSACQSTLLLFLQRYQSALAGYIPKGERLSVAIGKGHDALPGGTLCIGQCTARHKACGLFVPGCPPVASQILDVLESARSRKSDGRSSN